VLKALGWLPGRRILDLGCGKGRFAAHLRGLGADVIGLDLSRAMLGCASGIHRVRASARRLPFAGSSFDGVVAIEIIEHLSRRGLDEALAEVGRVLRPGAVLAIVDKNAHALDARRPWLPSLAVKWIDERRGLWMYPADGPVRERWFWPSALRARLEERFDDVHIDHLLSPEEEACRVFHNLPCTRLLTLWTARARGGGDG
jgi:2-polyprenyl-6-hydroxyphenyl methylase/3-demethylubiquinone-9 3-methyltransferase